MQTTPLGAVPPRQLRTSYIARCVDARERTKWMSALAFSMLLVRAARTHAIRHVRDAAIHGAQPAQGAAISPFITLACSQAPAPAPVTAREASEWAFWSVNRYTLVYITGAVLTAVVILVTHFFFLEYPNECVSLGILCLRSQEMCARRGIPRARSQQGERRGCQERGRPGACDRGGAVAPNAGRRPGSVPAGSGVLCAALLHGRRVAGASLARAPGQSATLGSPSESHCDDRRA